MAEKTVIIADKKGRVYEKPEVKMLLDKTYVVYREDKDVFLSVYENNKVTEIKNVSDNTFVSYEPELFISKNGILHISWCDQIEEGQHLIRYRSYDSIGGEWSEIFELDSLSCNNIEDLRITVDNSGNVLQT